MASVEEAPSRRVVALEGDGSCDNVDAVQESVVVQADSAKKVEDWEGVEQRENQPRLAVATVREGQQVMTATNWMPQRMPTLTPAVEYL